MRLHNWMVVHWKPAAAFCYTLICIFDFIVFPSWVGLHRVNLEPMLPTLQNFDITIQQEIVKAAVRRWEPLTLQGSGLFHLAFGALLTGAAVNKHVTDIPVEYTHKGVEYRRRKDDIINKEEEQ